MVYFYSIQMYVSVLDAEATDIVDDKVHDCLGHQVADAFVDDAHV